MAEPRRARKHSIAAGLNYCVMHTGMYNNNWHRPRAQHGLNLGVLNRGATTATISEAGTQEAPQCSRIASPCPRAGVLFFSRTRFQALPTSTTIQVTLYSGPFLDAGTMPGRLVSTRVLKAKRRSLGDLAAAL